MYFCLKKEVKKRKNICMPCRYMTSQTEGKTKGDIFSFNFSLKDDKLEYIKQTSIKWNHQISADDDDGQHNYRDMAN